MSWLISNFWSVVSIRLLRYSGWSSLFFQKVFTFSFAISHHAFNEGRAAIQLGCEIQIAMHINPYPLYLRRGVRYVPILEGGVQESGRRAGSENVMGMVGFGVAAEIASEELSHWQSRLRQHQEHLTRGLRERLDRVIFTGHPVQRLPGHVSLCLEFTEGEAMVRTLSRRGVAAATGSACRDYTTRKLSHVLEAIGLDIRLAQGSLVFSIGKDNTPEEIEYVLETLPPVVERLRAISPVYAQVKKS